MNPFDLILVAVVLAFAGIGALRGALRELLSVAVWVVALLMAWLFAKSASTWFSGFEDPTFRHMLAFVVVFACVFVLASLGTFVLRLILGVAVPNTQARIAGGMLGAARGVLMLLIIVSLAGLTSFPQKPWWRGSELVVYFQSMAQSVQKLLPAEVAQQFRYS
jgi:membrane protein required for colicin V production